MGKEQGIEPVRAIRDVKSCRVPLRHYPSFAIHRRLPPAPQANRISTVIYGNPLLSTGFAVSFAVNRKQRMAVCKPLSEVST